MAALQLEVRPPEDHYHSVDPHGFGVLGAMVIALAMMGPVLWADQTLAMSRHDLDQQKPPDAIIDRLIDLACYAA